MVFFVLSSSIFMAVLSWACPMCAGAEQEKDLYTVPLLAGFILLTYIPYAVIFRLIRKYRHLGESPPK